VSAQRLILADKQKQTSGSGADQEGMPILHTLTPKKHSLHCKKVSIFRFRGIHRRHLETRNEVDMHEVETYLVKEPFVDAGRAAAFLDMRRKTLLDMARKGKLPGHPVGLGQRRMWKFRISELESWMQSEVNSPQRLRSCSRRIS